MQTVLVFFIVGLAVAFLVYRAIRRRGGCGGCTPSAGGCAGCARRRQCPSVSETGALHDFRQKKGEEEK